MVAVIRSERCRLPYKGKSRGHTLKLRVASMLIAVTLVLEPAAGNNPLPQNRASVNYQSYLLHVSGSSNKLTCPNRRLRGVVVSSHC